MQKNFTHLITAVSRARNHRAVIATLLLFMLLLLAKSASAQAITAFPYNISFSETPAIISFQKGTPTNSTSSLGIVTTTGTNKEGYIEASAGQSSFNGYFYTGQTITFEKGFTYTISVKARMAFSGSTGKIDIVKGANFNAISTATGSNILSSSIINSNNVVTISTDFSINSSPSAPSSISERIGFHLYNSIGNKAGMYIDDISITKVCNLTAPTITDVARCGSGEVTLTAFGAPTDANYRWYDAFNNIIPGETSSTYKPTLSASHHFYVSVVIGGCESPRTQVLAKINPIPTAPNVSGSPLKAGTSEVTICSGDKATLTASGAPEGVSYNWYTTASGGTAITTNLSGTGNATYSPTLTNNTSTPIITSFYVEAVNPSSQGSCVSATRTKVDVTVNPLPTASIRATSNTQICPEGTVTLEAALVDGASYQWLFNNNPILDATAPTYAAGETGNYSVKVKTNDCEITSNIIPVLLITKANIIREGLAISHCEDGSTTLRALTSASTDYTYNYKWFKGTEEISNGSELIVTAPGSYHVELNTGSCIVISEPIEVTVNPKPTVSVNSSTTCAGIATNVAATVTTGTAPFTYAWTVPTGATNPGNVASFSTTVAGTYTVIVMDAKSCTSASASGTVTVNPKPTTPTITGITAGATYYTGGKYIGNTTVGVVNLSGSLLTGTRGTFTGPTGVLSATINGTNAATATLTLCNALAANENEKDITITYTVENNITKCTSSTSVIIKVKRSTYTVVLQTNFFPVCKSINTEYTARVLRDAEVIYPSTENIRYQAIEVKSFQEDVSALFTIVAKKNSDGNYNRDAKFNDASLSSTDFYQARATLIGGANACTGLSTTPIYSNQIWLGTPGDYSVRIAATPAGPICPNTEVIFRATPERQYAGLSYKWTVNGAVKQTGTSNEFKSSTLQNNDKVALTFTSTESLCGEQASVNEIIMTVYPPTAITTEPIAATVCQGGNTSFSVAANGNNLQYQWFVNNTKIEGATNATLNIINAQLTDNGAMYHVKVTGTCDEKEISTTPVKLTVNPSYNNALRQVDPITISGQLVYNEPATFIAHPANTYTDFNWTYEWTVNYSGGLQVKILNDKDNNAELHLTAEEMNINFVNVQARQIAPEGIPCVERFSVFRLSPQQTPLPVELIYLKATKQNNNVVELEWATAMEKNSEGFEVQVSQDAKNYRTLAFVASKAGGNTNEKQVYSFHDKENGKFGTRYYRLMQRDMNGDAEYFGPKAVKIGEAVESLKAYPNPFNSEVNLEINAEEAGSLSITVTNVAGSKVMERTLTVQKGNNREVLRFNSSLPQGMYIITTKLNGKTNHIRLMKQ